ncbi:MAG: PIN domain-containing protein [bacterium]
MPDKAFIDTNVLVYFISNDDERKRKAREVMLSNAETVVSSQVINEFISTCLKKNLLSLDDVAGVSKGFMRALHLSPVRESTINRALKLVKKYKYSYWDSLIIASAMENDCSILYTEDMQHGQVINNRLRIVNPFLT